MSHSGAFWDTLLCPGRKNVTAEAAASSSHSGACCDTLLCLPPPQLCQSSVPVLRVRGLLGIWQHCVFSPPIPPLSHCGTSPATPCPVASLPAWLAAQISTRHFGTLRRFRAEELALAANGFDEDNLLGEGGFSKVYKGTLEDGTVVAIKKIRVRTRGGTESLSH